MPVPSSLNDLSTTPSLNSPAGSESPALIDDYLRTQAAFIKQVSDSKDTLDAANVKLTGNQTIAGTKTFSSALGGTNIVPTAALQDDAVTFAKMQNVATATILGRSTAGTGDVEALTGAQVASTMTNAIGQLAGMRNKIINGGMTIAQRGTSFAGLTGAATYTTDRWQWEAVSSAVITASQQADVPSNNEYQNSLRLAVTTADASIAANDQAYIRQTIEGYNARDLIGKTFTISFWVRSAKTGTHCVALRNAAADRSYIAEYTINAANTWEQKSIAVVGGLITAGTWDWTNGVGLRVAWALAAGSTYQTTAGAWQTGPFVATSSQVNCLDTIGNIFAITGVQLEAGSVATPFEHRPYGVELALCQRYYEKVNVSGTTTSYFYAGTQNNMLLTWKVTKRASPTTTVGFAVNTATVFLSNIDFALLQSASTNFAINAANADAEL